MAIKTNITRLQLILFASVVFKTREGEETLDDQSKQCYGRVPENVRGV
jgi:hypothetical protein